MNGAGDFRTRLTLQSRDNVPDGQGGFVRSFSTVGKIWARVTPLASRADVVADRDGATLRVRIDVRAPLDLTLAHRFVDGAKIYRITGIRDDGRFVTIDAETRVG